MTNSAKKNKDNERAKMSPAALDVPSVLKNWNRGETRSYDSLLEMLTDPKLSSDELIGILRSIRFCVAQLDQSHEVLVGTLLRIMWPLREDVIIKEYRSFLLNLLSAHTYYLRAGLRMLVQHFLPSSVGDVTDEIRRSDEKKFMNIHLVLRAVSSIIPMTAKVLMPLLSNIFPFVLKPPYELECYTTNLLQIPQYMPDMRQAVLELILTKVIQLDVRCPRKDIEAAESELSEYEDDLMEEDGIKSMKHKEADKLDHLMDIIFKYIHKSVHDGNGELDWEACKKLYREMLLVFERIVLPTYASCHAQFIMFYMCSLHQSISEGFIDYLWKKFQNPNTETVYRQASVGYIGSFLSRAKFISLPTVKTCINLMTGWVHRYLEQLSSETIYVDLAHHSPFYSVCQAIFYVFCFRQKDILETKKGYKWAEGLQLQKIVTSRLNPLRFCLPIVVETFSSIARIHQLAFCDTIIEKNRRHTLPVSLQDPNGFSVHTVLLDSFFPFDPYLLLTSRGVIQPIYREYESSMPVIDEDALELEAEDDFLIDSRAESSAISIPHAPVRRNSKTSSDFLQYGTSPGFKHV